VVVSTPFRHTPGGTEGSCRGSLGGAVGEAHPCGGCRRHVGGDGQLVAGRSPLDGGRRIATANNDRIADLFDVLCINRCYGDILALGTWLRAKGYPPASV
jgi:hypothetical protein